MDKKVLIKNGVNHTVGITSPYLRVNMTWEKKGVVRSIDFDVLKELIYEPGVEQLFKDGYLVIDDMEVKKALGFEPEDADEPVNIIILTDTQKENLLKNKPFAEFKDKLDGMSYNQVHELANFCIDNNIMIDFEKNNYFIKRVSKDVMQAIKIAYLAKE